MECPLIFKAVIVIFIHSMTSMNNLDCTSMALDPEYDEKKMMVIEMVFLVIFAINLWVVGETRRMIYFETLGSNPHEVVEGESVDLICHQQRTDTVDIWGKLQKISYVTSGELNQGLPGTFLFSRNTSTCILTIVNITRHDSNYFVCRERKTKYLNLIVLYSPSQGEFPLCSSDYQGSLIFPEDLQEPFHFECKTEIGDPPVNMSLYVDKKGRRKLINDSELTITLRNNLRLFSFASHIGSLLDDVSLVCEVTQALPAPYPDYQESCSYGPLTLSPIFMVSIDPGNYTVVHGGDLRENISLTCTSNVSGVSLEWFYIPHDDDRFTVSRINESLILTVIDYGSMDDKSIIILCGGSYEGRYAFEHTIIDFIKVIESNRSASSPQSAVASSPVIVATTTVAIFFCLLIILGLLRCRKRPVASLNETIQLEPVDRIYASVNDKCHHVIEESQQQQHTDDQIKQTLRETQNEAERHGQSEDTFKTCDGSVSVESTARDHEVEYATISPSNNDFKYDSDLYLKPGTIQ